MNDKCHNVYVKVSANTEMGLYSGKGQHNELEYKLLLICTL